MNKIKTYKDVNLDLPNGLEEREKFYHKYGPLLPKPYGFQILVKTYIPPEKTSGGIYRPDQTLENSAYQNMIGLVLDTGPASFNRGEKFESWGNFFAKVGDWVM